MSETADTRQIPSAEEFFESLAEGARSCRDEFRVLPSITLAQAALESNWGRSQLADLGNNLFGIKAGRDWQGFTITMTTTEVIHGRSERVKASFRRYASWEESIFDHGRFLRGNPRYSRCFLCQTPAAFAQALQDAGYATDPEYAAKLRKIIESHGLERYDA